MIAELETNTGTLKREQQTTEIQRLNLGMLHASPTNPRQHFDTEALAELAESIEQHGVKMPLLARPSKTEPGKFEIVAGERRFRASTLLVSRLPERMELAGEDQALVNRLDELMATRVDVPVIVEDLDDATVLELQLIENLQRRDLTALEEARGYQRLLDLKEKGYTPQKIAQKIGKSVDTVLNKLKMLKSPVSLQKALEEGKVGERHLVLVARVPGQAAREKLAALVLEGEYDYDADATMPLGVRDLAFVIQRDYCESLKRVPWALEDAELLPEAGACVMCPHFARFAAEQDKDLAAELGNGRGQTDPLTCMNPMCAKKKHAAVFKQKKEEAKKHGTVTVLSPEEAAKLIHDGGSIRTTAVVNLDERPGFEQTGHYDNDKLPTWRELVEDRLPAGAVKVANLKEAGVVELVDTKLALAAAREHAKHGKMLVKAPSGAKKVLSDEEKNAKEKRVFDEQVTARSKLVLMTYLRDRAAEKGMDRDTALAVLDTVLHEAGKDGCQLMAETLAIAPREKLKNEMGVTAAAYRDPILAALRDQDVGKPEIDALIMLGVISKYVRTWGISFEALEPLQERFGFDEKTIKALATAEVKAEIEAKAAKKKPEKKAAKDHTDPTHIDSAKEASKTKAADKRHKEKVKSAQKSEVRSETSDVGIAEAKLGKATGWTPADVEAGAKLLKAKSQDITALIGSKPDAKKDAIAYKNWNGLRMKLLRKAGLAK